jgi:hypothetical protein
MDGRRNMRRSLFGSFGASSGGAAQMIAVSPRQGPATLRKPQATADGAAATTPQRVSPTSPKTPAIKEEDESEGSPSFNAKAVAASTDPLKKIGEPDHRGWLRKKAEQFNTWKLRFLVLKGPFLYYLKSDTVSLFRFTTSVNSLC